MGRAANAQRRVEFGRGGRPVTGWLLFAIVLSASPVHATDFNGNATIVGTATDNRGIESDNLEQRYSFTLFQPLTPYISARLGYSYFDLETSFSDGASFGRTISQPRIEFAYNRRNLSAGLIYLSRNLERSAGAGFDADSFVANVAWRPARGPGLIFRYRDERNIADSAVFGSDTHGKYFTAQVFYAKRWYSLNYTFRDNNLSRASVGEYELLQRRHELRFGLNRTFAQNRVQFNFGTTLTRQNQSTTIAPETPLVEPIPPREGLFAIDTSPEICELDPNPALIDGDLTIPVPGGEIGGGNTFRNFGVDLGVTTPLTRLEVTVDRPSGSNVQWQVYQSDDNLLWQRVGNEFYSFDTIFLRYTIRIPETTNRYFKAVNVTTNLAALVSVTEIRPLLDTVGIGQGEATDAESNRYRAAASMNYTPNNWISLGANVGAANDQDVAGGFTRREYKNLTAGARLGLRITPTLRYDLGARVNDSENLRDPVMLRTERVITSGFAWTPRPTVNMSLTAQRREEFEVDDPIQSNRTIRLAVLLDLLRDMRLISDIYYTRTDAATTGFDREGFTWSERLEMRPTPRWTLSLGVGGTNLERSDGEPVLDRNEYFADTTWSATSYLNLRGSWRLIRQAGGLDDFRQNYGLSYSPGPKLTFTASYRAYETVQELITTTDHVGVTYRFNKYLLIFGNLSRSSTELSGESIDGIVSSRIGIRIFI